MSIHVYLPFGLDLRGVRVVNIGILDPAVLPKGQSEVLVIFVAELIFALQLAEF
jgi:hypothetical protein